MQKNLQKDIIKVSFVIIFFLFLGFLGFSPLKAHAATLSISPSTGSFEAGDRVAVKVIATSNNVPFNAVSGLVSIPPALFSIESVSKINSVLDFWVTEPVISKNAGTVKFEGVALGGFAGASGTVITINLRAISVGTGSASFESGQILANDGEGTDITGNLNGATFYVKEATAKTTTPALVPVKETPTGAPEVIQPAPTLRAPEIMLGTKYGAEAILGKSDYPKAQTLITFAASDGTKIFIIDVADASGSFSVLIPNSLKRGEYTVTAVMIKSDKTNSDTSNSIIVQVGNIFSDMSPEVQLLLALLVLAVIYLILRSHMHLEKNELHEAEHVIHKSFDLLREDISERRNASGIKKDINDAEKIITKEIRDIK